MKKITALVLIILLVFTLSACSSSSGNTSELETTPYMGYILTPGILCNVDAGPSGSFSYEVLPSYNGDKISVVEEAESIVRKWWNDDSTFRSPKIVWVTIYGDFRGFQDPGYLFLDPNTSYEDLLATAVHEWLHELVDPSTLINLETGWARPVMEYVVESITLDLLEGIVEIYPSSTYNQFKGSALSRPLPKLQKAFRAEKSIEAYEEIFGKNYKEIITQIIRENT